MESNHITFEVGDEQLAGEEILPSASTRPRALILHGAGQSSKERTSSLAWRLAEHGIGSFRFDFSGHGESSGELGASSLRKRTNEARAASRFLSLDEPRILLAFSMGGHVAIRLAGEVPFSSLLLFAPAVYHNAAFEVPFGGGFSEIIRQPDSWKCTEVVGTLRNFQGTLLIVTGEQDDVIPPGVLDLFTTSAERARKVEILALPQVGHKIAEAISQDASLLDTVVEKLLEFC